MKQLTIDGTEVPHERVVKGPSDSRVLRRPVDFETNEFMAGHVSDEDSAEFVGRLIEVFDRARIGPGDAFYLSRLPKPLPPAPRKSRGAPKGFPRRGMRRRVLDAVLRAGDQGAERDALVYSLRTLDRVVLPLLVADADRRVRELLEAGFVAEHDGRLVATDKARRGLAVAQGRAEAQVCGHLRAMDAQRRASGEDDES